MREVLDIARKQMAIRLDTYEKLIALKRGRDTFSDVIDKLMAAYKEVQK